MSALAKFLAKLEVESPHGAATIKKLLTDSQKVRAMRDEAALMDKTAKTGFFGKTKGERDYSAEWLKRPEIQGAANNLNRDYGRLDPDLERQLFGVMDDYPSTHRYNVDVADMFGQGPVNLTTHPEYLEMNYHAPADTIGGGSRSNLEVREEPDSVFNSYGERRTRKK